MARPLPAASDSVGAQLVTGAGALVGLSCRENAGTPAAAVLFLRDGTSSAGKELAVVTLSGGGSQTIQLPAVQFTTGLYLDRVSGTTEAVIYVL
jgi:pyrimidine deaminase RibD-like protein